MNKSANVRGQHGELQFSAYAIFAICAFWARLAHARTPTRGADPKTSPIMLFCCVYCRHRLDAHFSRRNCLYVPSIRSHLRYSRISFRWHVNGMGRERGRFGRYARRRQNGSRKNGGHRLLSLAGTQLAVGSGISIVIVRLRGISVPINFTTPMKMLMQYGIAVTAYYVFLVPVVHKFSFKKAQATSIAITHAYLSSPSSPSPCAAQSKISV